MKKNKKSSMKQYVWGGLILALSVIALFAPLASLFIYNYDIWVAQDATKITMGVLLGFVYALFVLKGALKEISTKAATLLSLCIFAGIIWFLNSMIDQLFIVIVMIIIGYILFWILSSIGKNMIKWSKVEKEERVRVKVRKEVNESLSGV